MTHAKRMLVGAVAGALLGGAPAPAMATEAGDAGAVAAPSGGEGRDGAAHVTSSIRRGLLATALDAAWLRAADAREAEGRVAEAAAESDVASSWAAGAPSLEVANRSGDWGNAPGVRESDATISWPVWMPGQRSASRAAAVAGVQAATAGEHAARLRLAGQLREALWELANRDAEHRSASAIAAHLRTLAADAERRAAAGEVPPIEALSARAEVLAAESAADEAAVELDTAARSWTLLTGLPAPAQPAAELEGAPAPSDADDAVARHPEVVLAAAAAERAKALFQAAKRSSVDPPELSLVYRDEVAGAGESAERSVGVAVRIPFGGARTSAQTAAAATGMSVAQATAQRTLETQAAEIAGARRALDAAEARYAAEQTRLGLLRERLEHVEKSFRAGETSLADVLRERIAAAQADADHGRRRAALGLARARLHQALGSLP